MEAMLEEFLFNRGIEDNLIAKMKDEKLDCKILSKIKDDVLKEFLPKYGDRYAVKEFCNQNLYNSSTTRRESLIDKLKRKIDERDTSKNKFDLHLNENEPCTSSSRKTKNTRMVYLGWICDDIQVRGKFGGGTRRTSMSKNDKKEEILKKALDLFFPQGESPKGPLKEFNYDLLDFQRNRFDDTMSVGEFFAITGCTVLRFYLTTTRQQQESKDNRSSNGQRNEHNDGEANAANSVNLDQFLIFNENNSVYNLPPAVTSEESIVNDVSNDTFYSRLSPTIPEVEINYVEIVTKTMQLHRGQVFSELIDECTTVETWMIPIIHINVELFQINGQKEAAVDGGGVFKDVLTEFWNSFYDLCCNGTFNKVPLIRHDFIDKWEPIAKILLLGYKQVKYFPMQLARPFIEYSIFNETKQDLIEALLNFVGKEDSELLQKALSNLESVAKDDLLDAMEALDCKQLVTSENISKIMKDIAHKEFIQKPKYIIDIWHNILRNKITNEELNEIYDIRKLSNKNVLKILQFPEPSMVDIDKTIGFLKKFIREAETDILKRFLRFCTGADVLTGQDITIQFITTTGFRRVPVSHTCSGTLDLPTYDTYNELKSEFGAVLKSNVWVMDLV